MIDKERLAQKCSTWNIVLSGAQLDLLDRYAEILVDYNQKVNLTAITSPEGIEDRHFADSLLFAAQPEVTGKLVDVGTGAGFPGVVAKIFKPDLQLTLMEPTGKRVDFLKYLCGELGLTGVEFAKERAEEAARKIWREQFDVASARAVAALPVLCEYCLPLVRVGGVFIAMKGPDADAELGGSVAALKKLGGAYGDTRAFTLPDGSPIPEYEFLPEDWGTWPDMDTLLLTVGRGGDAGEPHTYRCTVRMNQDGTLSGSALEQTTEVLSEDYDFDHDGMPETTELVTVLTPETDYYPAWYILQVIRQDGVELWSAGAHPSHAGWTSVFACKIDGEDYLLQYEPEMYQGWAEYAYELWAFDGNGQAYTSDNRSVTFDINFGREEHQFDPEAIAGFFWELRGLLQDSILLASTENGEFQTGIPGLELQNYIFSDLLSLDSLEAMEASVRQQEAELGAA